MFRFIFALSVFAGCTLPLDDAADRPVPLAPASEAPCVEYAFYVDADGDGYVASDEPVYACFQEAGLRPDLGLGADCDDTDAGVHPNRSERCNDVDDDCDGEVDEDLYEALWFADADGDGFGDIESTMGHCGDPGEGWTSDTSDCDDGDAGVNPAAPELCDGVDQNCNGQADEFPIEGHAMFWDMDGDGYGDDSSPVYSCDPPDPAVLEVTGQILEGGDCDDWDAEVNPDGTETCDGIDDNCDGVIDDGFPVADFYFDSDGDGHGDPGSPTVAACAAPPEHAPSDDDCDIWDGSVYPGAVELCDGLDNDCDGVTTEEWSDEDGDGFSVCDGDCDDTSAATAPGAVEVCDGLDNDCSGRMNDPWHDLWEPNDIQAEASQLIGDDDSITIHPTVSGADDEWFGMDTEDDPDNFFNGDAFYARATVTDLPPGTEATLHLYRINMLGQTRHVTSDSTWQDGSLHVERGGVWLSNDSNQYWARLEVHGAPESCDATYTLTMANGG